MRALIVDGPAAGKIRELANCESSGFCVYIAPPFSIAKPVDSSVIPDDSVYYRVHRLIVFSTPMYIASVHADVAEISGYNLITYILSADAREVLL